MPRNIGELGPGATLGTCIAALLDGIESAGAFDAGNYASTDENLRLLTELSDGAPNDMIRLSIGNAGSVQAVRFVMSLPGQTHPYVRPTVSI